MLTIILSALGGFIIGVVAISALAAGHGADRYQTGYTDGHTDGFKDGVRSWNEVG